MAYELVGSAGDQGLLLDHARGITPVFAEGILRPLEQRKSQQRDAYTRPARPWGEWQGGPVEPGWMDGIDQDRSKPKHAEKSGRFRYRALFAFFQCVLLIAMLSDVIAAVQSERDNEHKENDSKSCLGLHRLIFLPQKFCL